MPLRKPRTVQVLVVLLASAFLCWVYYVKAWQETMSSSRGQATFNLICDLIEAIERYKGETGEYPPHLRALASRYPGIVLPEASGPHRVEYVPAREQAASPIFRCYGLKEAVRGWNLKRDDVVWEIGMDHRIREVPVR